MQKFTQKINEAREFKWDLKSAMVKVTSDTRLDESEFFDLISNNYGYAVAEIAGGHLNDYDDFMEFLNQRCPHMAEHKYVAQLYLKYKVLSKLPDNMDVFRKINEE